MKHRIVTVGLVAFTLTASMSPAARSHDRDWDPARAEQHMEEVAQRLKLTEEQKLQLRPIVEEHVAKAKSVRDRYPAETPRAQKREMFQELHSVREAYDAKVRDVLNEEQRKEWERMRSERRERMREHGREMHREST
jgi:protein CpxP